MAVLPLRPRHMPILAHRPGERQAASAVGLLRGRSSRKEGVMGNKLFVGGLAWATTDVTLKEAFSKHGQVREARVVLDKETGRSRGFGFVTFATEEEAARAKDAMNGAMIDDRAVRVDFSQEKERTERPDRGPMRRPIRNS
jgi:RNA recognition motif-containing protein